MTAKSALIIALIIHAALLALPGFTMDTPNDDPARPLAVGLIIGGGGGAAGAGEDAAGTGPVAEPAGQVAQAQEPLAREVVQKPPQPEPQAAALNGPEPEPASEMQPEPEPRPAQQPETASAPKPVQAEKAKAKPKAVAASQERKPKAKAPETATHPKPKPEPQKPEQNQPHPTREAARAEPATFSGQAVETDLIALAGPGQGQGKGPDSLPRFGLGDLNGPVVTGCPELSYPARARRMGVEGEVMVEARIGPDGRVQDVTVVDGPGLGLERAAREFVQGCRFKPALRDGEPITSIAEIPIRFNLR